MIEVVQYIIEHVLIALYQTFGCAVILAVLLMFLFLFIEEHGWKESVRRWLYAFKVSGKFRRMFFLFFYIAMILLKTLLNRNMWANPVSNVIGVWGLYNDKGDFTTEALENFVLFVPFTILLLWNFQGRILGQSKKLLKIMGQSVLSTLLFALAIEFVQLFLRIGTFQLSDLFYNTFGGLIGGLIYWCGYRIVQRNKV